MNRRFLRQARSRVKTTSLQLLLSFFCICFLLIAELLVQINDMSPAIIILLASCSGLLGFTALVIDNWTEITIAWKNPLIKLVVLFTAFLVSGYSLHLADNAIFEYTLLSPSTFPRAQTLLASAIAPILWMVIFLVLFLVLYFIQAFFVLKKILSSIDWLVRSAPYRLLRIIFSIPARPVEALNILLEFSKLIGLALMGLIVMPLLLQLISSEGKIDWLLMRIFVVSGFYTNGKACHNINEKDQIFILENSKAIHFLEDITPSFQIVECKQSAGKPAGYN